MNARENTQTEPTIIITLTESEAFHIRELLWNAEQTLRYDAEVCAIRNFLINKFGYHLDAKKLIDMIVDEQDNPRFKRRWWRGLRTQKRTGFDCVRKASEMLFNCTAPGLPDMEFANEIGYRI
jgi:hypothetical protein